MRCDLAHVLTNSDISHNTSPTLTLAEVFHQFQGRRFTGSVWPEKSKYLSLLDFKGHTADRLDFPK